MIEVGDRVKINNRGSGIHGVYGIVFKIVNDVSVFAKWEYPKNQNGSMYRDNLILERKKGEFRIGDIIKIQKSIWVSISWEGVEGIITDITTYTDPGNHKTTTLHGIFKFEGRTVEQSVGSTIVEIIKYNDKEKKIYKHTNCSKDIHETLSRLKESGICRSYVERISMKYERK